MNSMPKGKLKLHGNSSDLSRAIYLFFKKHTDTPKD